MMTSPISTTLPISELTAARRYLLKCRTRLAEMRALLGRARDDGVARKVAPAFAVTTLLIDLAVEDATTEYLAALSWAWDAQVRATT